MRVLVSRAWKGVHVGFDGLDVFVVLLIEQAPTYTYIAGCTDSTYQDSSCPNKGNYTDYQWVGLQSCNPYGKEPWVGCVNDGSATVTVSEESEGCTCDLTGDDPDQVLIDTSIGTAAGFLPDSLGDKIDFLPGIMPVHTSLPSSSTTSSTTKSSSTPSSSASTIRSSTSTSSTAPSHTSSASTSTPTPTSVSAAAIPSASKTISTGAKVGIVISALAGAAIMIVLAIFLIRRRKRELQQSCASDVGSLEKPPLDLEPTLPAVGTPDPQQSPIGYSFKPELPGSPTYQEINEVGSRGKYDYDAQGHLSPSLISPTSSVAGRSDHSPHVYASYRPNTMEEIQELPEKEQTEAASRRFHLPNYRGQAQSPGVHELEA